MIPSYIITKNKLSVLMLMFIIVINRIQIDYYNLKFYLVLFRKEFYHKIRAPMVYFIIRLITGTSSFIGLITGTYGLLQTYSGGSFLLRAPMVYFKVILHVVPPPSITVIQVRLCLRFVIYGAFLRSPLFVLQFLDRLLNQSFLPRCSRFLFFNLEIRERRRNIEQ